jgi:RNase adaptor protein for sRNA GlmZ degradation
MSNNGNFDEIQIKIVSYGHQFGKLKDFDLNHNIINFNPPKKIKKNKIICPESQQKYKEILYHTYIFLKTVIKKNKKQITIGINCIDGQVWSVIFAKLLGTDLNEELIEGTKLKTIVKHRDATCHL